MVVGSETSPLRTVAKFYSMMSVRMHVSECVRAVTWGHGPGELLCCVVVTRAVCVL